MISPRLPSYTYLLLFSHERGAVEPTKLSGAPYLLQPLDPKCRKAQSNLSGSPHVNALVRNSDGTQVPRDRNETKRNLNSFVDCRRREIVPLFSSPSNAHALWDYARKRRIHRVLLTLPLSRRSRRDDKIRPSRGTEPFSPTIPLPSTIHRSSLLLFTRRNTVCSTMVTVYMFICNIRF